MGEPARRYSWPPFEPGNEAALRHGADSPRVLAPLATAIAEGIRDVVPHLASPVFAPDVEALAWAEAECRLRRADLDERGLTDESGEDRAGVERWHRAESRRLALRRELGLTPVAMSRVLTSLSGAAGAVGDESFAATLRAGTEAVARAVVAGLLEPSVGGSVPTSAVLASGEHEVGDGSRSGVERLCGPYSGAEGEL
jgi:hypothetical protein